MSQDKDHVSQDRDHEEPVRPEDSAPEEPHGLGEDLLLPTPPFWMIAAFIIVVVLTWLPLVFIARARVVKSESPRLHLIQDMDIQPRFGPQAESSLFADGRAMRPSILGTVARGELEEDDHYHRGYTTRFDASTGKWETNYFTGYPSQLELTEASLLRGQERFNIYCAPCHGLDGYGLGIVHRRATELEESNWVPPSSLHTDTVKERENGHLYNTINNGIRNMAGYGAQIPVDDRWKIVLYIRALQFSQNAGLNDVPEEIRSSLR